MIRNQNKFIPFIIFLLLWGMMAFAVHDLHDHDATHSDNDCQICQFALNSSSVIPASELTPLAIPQHGVKEIQFDTHFTVLTVKTQQARAPPITC